MPYKTISEAEKKNPGIRNLSAKEKRVWVATFNSAKERGYDDETAAKMAWAAVRRLEKDMEPSIYVSGADIAIGIPFEKIDVKNRTVEGFATLDNVDSAGEIVDFEASAEAFKHWLGNIREMHGPKAVGKALSVEEREKEHNGQTYRGFYVKAYISKGAQDTWEKILDGTLKGFSLGGRVLEKRAEIVKGSDPYAKRHVTRITKYTLNELSVVDNPANPLALFEGVERRSLIKFVDGVVETSDVLAKDDEFTETNIFYCETCDIAKTTTGGDECDCPICDTKMTHIATSYEAVEDDYIKKMVSDYKQNFEKLTNDSAEDEEKQDDLEKREFSEKERKRLAEQGMALPDGSFPIVTVEDLKNAIRSIGRAKDRAAAMEHIVRRARALGRMDLIPEDWNVRKSDDDVNLHNNNKDNNLEEIIASFVDAIASRIAKTEMPIDKKEERMPEGLERILNVLKSAISEVEEILAKAGIVPLNDEDAKEVEHVEDVSLPAGSDEAVVGNVEGPSADVETFAETPGSSNVLPKVEKSEEPGELIKVETMTEELKKFTERVESVLSDIGAKFNELSERITKLENSGAEKKSGEINVTEELKKSQESFWGGKFLWGEL